MSFHPWAERFAKPWTDEAIDATVEVPALPVRLQGLAADPAAEAIRVRLEKIFVSGEQARQVLRTFTDTALVHATSHFISKKAYTRGSMSRIHGGDCCSGDMRHWFGRDGKV
jgi:hypothetical protein